MTMLKMKLHPRSNRLGFTTPSFTTPDLPTVDLSDKSRKNKPEYPTKKEPGAFPGSAEAASTSVCAEKGMDFDPATKLCVPKAGAPESAASCAAKGKGFDVKTGACVDLPKEAKLPEGKEQECPPGGEWDPVQKKCVGVGQPEWTKDGKKDEEKDEEKKTSPWMYVLGGAALLALGAGAFYALSAKKNPDKNGRYLLLSDGSPLPKFMILDITHQFYGDWDRMNPDPETVGKLPSEKEFSEKANEFVQWLGESGVVSDAWNTVKMHYVAALQEEDMQEGLRNLSRLWKDRR